LSRALQGCGTGTSSVFLATCGYSVVGVDIVQQAINSANAAAAAVGVGINSPASLDQRSMELGRSHHRSKGDAVFLRYGIAGVSGWLHATSAVSFSHLFHLYLAINRADVFDLPTPFTYTAALQLLSKQSNHSMSDHPLNPGPVREDGFQFAL
jgi:hypothetical protein